MIAEKFNEKLIEFFMELAKPKKYEAGYVTAGRIITEGSRILGMNANDILGFTKSDSERRIRRVRGAEAWFKDMYNKGWRYAGNFEYEGLLNRGFVVMEKELPNKVLEAIRDELKFILKEDDSKYKHPVDPEKLRGLPGIIAVPGSLKTTKPREDIDITKATPDDIAKLLKEAMSEKSTPYVSLDVPYSYQDKVSVPYKTPELIKKIKEGKEGFESDINDFMIESQKEMKTLEELFFEDTGKNAVWHGKETKAYKGWKENLVIKDAD